MLYFDVPLDQDLVLAISGEDEELTDTSLAKDSITIKDWYVSPGQIEKLAFYQTGILDIISTKTLLIAGTDGADGTTSTPLAGTVLADWITGAAGDDSLLAATAMTFWLVTAASIRLEVRQVTTFFMAAPEMTFLMAARQGRARRWRRTGRCFLRI